MKQSFSSYSVERYEDVIVSNEGSYGKMNTLVVLVDRLRTRDEAEALLVDYPGARVGQTDYGFVPSWAK